jgi:hypothetical protein
MLLLSYLTRLLFCCRGAAMLQVEKAPVVIKTGVSKADAEAMQKQLEAGEAAVQHAAAGVSMASCYVIACTECWLRMAVALLPGVVSQHA